MKKITSCQLLPTLCCVFGSLFPLGLAAAGPDWGYPGVKDTGKDLKLPIPEFALEDLVEPGEVVADLGPPEASLFGPRLVKAGDGEWMEGFGDSQSVAMWKVVIPETRYYRLEIEFQDTASKGTAQGIFKLDNRLLRILGPGTQGSTGSLVFPALLIGNGIHEFTLWQGWKGLRIGRLKLVAAKNFLAKAPDALPVNPKATVEVQRVMAFLGSIWGRYIVSGQMDVTWNSAIDMIKRVKESTGREPGLMGYDFLDINPRTRRNDQTDEAIAWWKRGGLVAFCWHWRAGSSEEFYTGKTDFRINRNPDSAEYKFLVNSIDRVASELKRLQKAGVAVLWRPLHEASGAWFWWGATGPDDYLWLYNLMYERLVIHHELNNLIWVWNGQNPDWYPGDDRVDVIGLDIYPEKPGDHASQVDRFMEALSWSRGNNKLMALSENGAIPDPDLLAKDGVAWAWFMTWNDGANPKVDQDNFFSGKIHNDQAFRTRVFNHPYVLTLDELPAFHD